LDANINHAQAKRAELLKLGTSTFFYVTVGAATGSLIVATMPDTNVAAVMKQVTEQVGVEIISFSYGNMLKGLNSVALNVPADLQKKVESNASKVRYCLDGFFQQVTSFHMKIGTVIKGIDQLKVLNSKLQVKLQSEPADDRNIADWVDISTYLQQIYGALINLKEEVIEKKENKVPEFDEAIDELISGVEVTTAGTPV